MGRIKWEESRGKNREGRIKREESRGKNREGRIKRERIERRRKKRKRIIISRDVCKKISQNYL